MKYVNISFRMQDAVSSLCSKKFETLSFNGQDENEQVVALMEFSNHAFTLKKLSLLDFNESNSLRIIHCLENLESLTLGNCRDQMVSDILMNLSSDLKYLKITNYDFNKLGQLEKELKVRELEVFYCHGSDGFKQLLEKCSLIFFNL